MKDDNKGEPIVLGTLKKEKSSKPVFVIIVLLLVSALVFYIPQVKNYFEHGSGTIPELYRSTVGKFLTGEDDYGDDLEDINEEELYLLSDTLVLNKAVITISNIKINGNTISYKIVGKSEVNLDNSNFNLELYNSNKELLGKFKLTGTINKEVKEESKTLDFIKTDTSYYLNITTN